MTPVLVALSLLFFTVAASYRRSWGVAVILFALPSYLIRFELTWIPMTLLEAYILLLFLVWCIGLLRSGRGLTQAWRLAGLSRAFVGLSLAWVGLGLAASFWSKDPGAGLGLWKAYFLEPVLFAWVLISTSREVRVWRSYAISLGLGAALIGIVSLLQALGAVPSPLPWSEQMPPRFSSLFEYPNAVGLLLAPILAFAIGFLAKYHALRLPERLWLWGAIFFGLIAIGLAVSEGAILGIIAAVLLCILMSRSWKRWIAGVLILVAILAVIPQTRDYLSTLATFRDTSGDVRLRMWEGTMRLLAAHPLEGAGLGGFPALYDQYRDAAHVELLLYPHNVFLNFWVELGIFGLLLFLALVLRFFLFVARAYRQNGEAMRATTIGLLMAMTALLIHGVVDVPYFKNDLAVLFWVLLAGAELVRTGQKPQKAL